MAQLKRLLEERPKWKSESSRGQKPRRFFAALTARLKPRPSHKAQTAGFSAARKAEPLHLRTKLRGRGARLQAGKRPEESWLVWGAREFAPGQGRRPLHENADRPNKVRPMPHISRLRGRRQPVTNDCAAQPSSRTKALAVAQIGGAGLEAGGIAASPASLGNYRRRSRRRFPLEPAYELGQGESRKQHFPLVQRGAAK